MRIGNSYSRSYRLVNQRRRLRRLVDIGKLCSRLDRLVHRAEGFKRGSRTRVALFERAERVRTRLREIDH